MSSTAADVGKLISMVGLHFPPPRFPDEQTEAAWTASMVRFLAPYTPEVLAATAEHIIKTRDPSKQGMKWFPAPAEIIKIADLLRRASDTRETPLLTHGERDKSQFAGWRTDLANELVGTSEIGKEAARNGWVKSLWDWCRKFGALPRSQREVSEVKGEAAQFDAHMRTLRAGEGGAFNGALLKLGESLLQRRKELEQRVLGEAAE